MKRSTLRRLIILFLIIVPTFFSAYYQTEEEGNIAFWVIVTVLLVYFLPSLIGANKKKYLAIFWLNILAGWTFIGYVVSFVWALKKD